MPGFRKGHVPPSIIRQRFSEDIKTEVVETLVPRYSARKPRNKVWCRFRSHELPICTFTTASLYVQGEFRSDA